METSALACFEAEDSEAGVTNKSIVKNVQTRARDARTLLSLCQDPPFLVALRDILAAA